MENFVIKGNPARSLYANSLGFFIGLAATALFGALSKYLKSIGLDPVQIALLVSIPSLTGSLLRIPFSAWVDTTGGKKPFSILLYLSILGLIGISIVMGVLNSDTSKINSLYPLLLIFGAFAGCGGATFSVGITATSYWFSKKTQGDALGKYAGFGNMGPGFATLLLTWVLLPKLGLVKTYYVWTAFLVVGTIIYLFFSHNAWCFQIMLNGKSLEEAKKIASNQFGQEMFPSRSISETLLESAKVYQTWIMVFVYFLSFGGFLAITAWLPTYYTVYHGIDLKYAGLMTATFSIGTSLFRALIGGKISDKLGGFKVTAYFLIVIAIGALGMMFIKSGGNNVYLAFIATMVIALGLGVVNASIFRLLPDFIPKAIGGASGWIGGIGAFGGFAYPNLLARFITTGGSGDAGYAKGFSVFLIWAIISFIVTLIFLRKKD